MAAAGTFKHERPVRFALLASFSVYFLPVYLRHGLTLWGAAVISELSGTSDRHSSWVMADIAFALVVQGFAALLFYSYFYRPGVMRLLMLIVAAPVLFLTIEAGHLFVVPIWFSVEADSKPAQATWPVECTAPGARLAQVLKGPVTLTSGGPPEAWITLGNLAHGVLAMPGCRILTQDASLTGANFAGKNPYIDFAIPGGGVLYNTDGNQRWLIPATGQAPQRIEDPPTHTENDQSPILSNDGEWIAWGVREGEPGTGNMWFGVLIRRLRDHHETKLEYKAFAPRGINDILELTANAEELIVCLRGDEYAGVGPDGTMHWGPIKPQNVDPQEFRRVAGGWVAWGNDYVDNRPSGVEWSLPAGSAFHRVLSGRRISSAAVDPDGRYIALAVSASTRVGNAQNAVYVLSTANGSEVFRQFFDRLDRNTVAFLGAGYFAYSAREGTTVLRLPD